MPELPEVEVTRRALAPALAGRRLIGAKAWVDRLRWPLDPGLGQLVAGRAVEGLERRGKWLLLQATGGAVLLHLGMTGSLRMEAGKWSPGAHDRIALLLENGNALVLRDPRRFGAVLWAPGDPWAHPRLSGLGPEPLEAGFSGAWLREAAQGRRANMKAFLMSEATAPGVGNIYASEALWRAGIRPATRAGRVSRPRLDGLAAEIKALLAEAIAHGGTTVRDFVGGDGQPGRFAQRLAVYGRAGQPCLRCATAIRRTVVGGRATFHCPCCQT